MDSRIGHFLVLPITFGLQLESYYEKMGLRFDYSRVIDFARRSLGLPDISAYTDLEKEEYLLRVF